MGLFLCYVLFGCDFCRFGFCVDVVVLCWYLVWWLFCYCLWLLGLVVDCCCTLGLITILVGFGDMVLFAVFVEVDCGMVIVLCNWFVGCRCC